MRLIGRKKVNWPTAKVDVLLSLIRAREKHCMRRAAPTSRIPGEPQGYASEVFQILRPQITASSQQSNFSSKGTRAGKRMNKTTKQQHSAGTPPVAKKTHGGWHRTHEDVRSFEDHETTLMYRYLRTPRHRHPSPVHRYRGPPPPNGT